MHRAALWLSKDIFSSLHVCLSYAYIYTSELQLARKRHMILVVLSSMKILCIFFLLDFYIQDAVMCVSMTNSENINGIWWIFK